MDFLDPDPTFAVWGNVRIRLYVVNGGPDSEVQVLALRLSLPDRLGVEWKGATQASDGFWDVQIPDGMALHLAGERSQPFVIEALPRSWTGSARDIWWILLHRPRTLNLIATLNYRSLASIEGDSVTEEALLPLKVGAHPLGMYVGALLGAILGGLLLRLVGTGQQDPLLKRILRGMVTSAIVLLAVQATSASALPITIEVHDFFGGVVLGLLADGIAVSLRDWITGPPHSSSQPVVP